LACKYIAFIDIAKSYCRLFFKKPFAHIDIGFQSAGKDNQIVRTVIVTQISELFLFLGILSLFILSQLTFYFMSEYPISAMLRAWYEANCRDLPWRRTRNPYFIWLSEVILQQTRVDQGLGYYLRFVERFPTVEALAAADEAEVLKYWQGLGYYCRARNLHAAARDIASRPGALFPRSYEDVRALRGVGDYTAAAIVSFAYDEPHAVVDGNVYRVLSRLLGIATPIDTGAGKREFAEAASLLLDPAHAAQHNQAVMELGALVCTPAAPQCDACPLGDLCVARAEGRIAELPVKQGKTRVRDRRFCYLLLEHDGRTWLHRRPEGDIWAGLYEFPLIESDAPLSPEELFASPAFRAMVSGEAPVVRHVLSRRHVLSHQRIHAEFYHVRLSEPPRLAEEFVEVPLTAVADYPVSRLVHLAEEKMGWEGPVGS
jgi:A/G-specific adenine glycosylase